ncbi:unnamed protein product, partial [Meganyctiphanes norvegica]
MSESFVKEESGANFVHDTNAYNISNVNNDVAVKKNDEKSFKPDERYYPQEVSRKSALGISEVMVKEKIEVNKEQMNNEYVDTQLKEDIEVYEEAIAITGDSNLVKQELTYLGERSNQTYQCSYCDKTFSENTKLGIHQNTHLIPDCGDNKSILKNIEQISHQRTHTEEKPYQCCQCDKAFLQKSELLSHQRTHTVEKLYQCSQCAKTFSNKNSLINHQRTHTGVKPYRCNQCDKSFLW